MSVRRGSWLKAAVCVVGLAAMRAGAITPQLPDNAIGEDAIVVATFDPNKLTSDALQASSQAIMGPNAQRDEQKLSDFQKKRDAIVAAGGEAATIVMSMPAKEAGAAAADAGSPPEPKPVVYVKMKAGADETALKNAITQDMSQEDKDKTQFDRQGDFLVMHEKGQTLPTSGSAERAKAFNAGFADAGDSAASVVLVPNEALKAQVNGMATNAPPAFREILPALMSSKWISLSGKVGSDPSVALVGQAADDASAKQIVDHINDGVARLKQMADQMKQNPHASSYAAMFSNLADALKPTQEGSKVTVTLNKDALSTIAQFGVMRSGMAPGRRPMGQQPPPDAGGQ